jgi:hypothetical protein
MRQQRVDQCHGYVTGLPLLFSCCQQFGSAGCGCGDCNMRRLATAAGLLHKLSATAPVINPAPAIN